MTDRRECRYCGVWVGGGVTHLEDCALRGEFTDGQHIRDRVRPEGTNIGRSWEQKAIENEQEWGIQHPEELLSAIGEEVGEIEQAYLEATHEGGDPEEVEGEVDDLGPLLMQLVESVRTHPMAFDPLPTAREADSDE